MEFTAHHCNNFMYYSGLPASITHCGDWKASTLGTSFGNAHAKATWSGVGSDASAATVQFNTDTLQSNMDLYMYCTPAASGYDASLSADNCVSRKWRTDITAYNCDSLWSYSSTDVSVCIPGDLATWTTAYADHTSWFTNAGTSGGLCNPVSSHELLWGYSVYSGTNVQLDSTTG